MQSVNETKSCIIYCRVSSKDQVDGTSLESQERICREYAERQNMTVVKVYVEMGESAKTIDRTEFNKALLFVTNKKNKIGYFLVYKVDRFARNQDDHVSVTAILKRSGVELKSATEVFDSSSVGRLTEGMLSVIAEFDNNQRTERTKGGMLERVKQGIWQWPAPLGYHRRYKGANIAPEPETAPLIRLGFEEYSKGTYTYQSLAEFLTAKGLKTKGGKKPYNQLIEKIIKNPVYCGVINVWGKYEGTFEPLISKKLFNKCQEGYKESVHIAPRSANNPLFPLRGVLCSVCNKSLTGSPSTGRKGKKYLYYHHAKQDCSKAQSIPKETFEQLFVEYLNEITPSGKYEKLFKSVVLDTWKGNYQQYYDNNTRLRKEVDSLEQERLKIFEFHRAGRYSDEEFTEQKAMINETIYKKRQLMQEQAVEEFDMEEALNYCFGFVRSSAQTWLEADYPSKLRFQKLVSKEKIKFNEGKFGTATLSSVYKLNQEYNGEKSNLVVPTGIEPVFSG